MLVCDSKVRPTSSNMVMCFGFSLVNTRYLTNLSLSGEINVFLEKLIHSVGSAGLINGVVPGNADPYTRSYADYQL